MPEGLHLPQYHGWNQWIPMSDAALWPPPSLFRSERQALESKISQLDAQLGDARADRRESQREKKMAEAVEGMKRLFPGGRIGGWWLDLGDRCNWSHWLHWVSTVPTRCQCALPLPKVSTVDLPSWARCSSAPGSWPWLLQWAVMSMTSW